VPPLSLQTGASPPLSKSFRHHWFSVEMARYSRFGYVMAITMMHSRSWRRQPERLGYACRYSWQFERSYCKNAVCDDLQPSSLSGLVICTITRFWNRVPGCNYPGTRYPVSTRAQDINCDLRGGDGVDGCRVNNQRPLSLYYPNVFSYEP